MKILVTGGAGYVGSHAVKSLTEAGHQVVVYDNLSAGHRTAVLLAGSTAELVVGDLLEQQRLTDLLAERKSGSGHALRCPCLRR